MLDNALFIVVGVEPQIHHGHGQTHLSVKKKKIIEWVWSAASKITQQKGSVKYREDSIKDSITHCGVAIINSLPLQRPLIIKRTL